MTIDIDAAVALAVPLVFRAEGCRLMAYLDTLPAVPVWTIGHGSTWVDGRAVGHGMVCTVQQADAWAAADLRVVAEQVMRHVTVVVDEYQLAALSSLAFNIGIGHFERSSVLAALNAGLHTAAADRFLEYDEAGGRAVAGLETRRGQERALFLTASHHERRSHDVGPPRGVKDRRRSAVAPPPTTDGRASGTTTDGRASGTTTDDLNQREIDSLDPLPPDAA